MQIWENADQNNSEYGHSLCNEMCKDSSAFQKKKKKKKQQYGRGQDKNLPENEKLSILSIEKKYFKIRKNGFLLSLLLYSM